MKNLIILLLLVFSLLACNNKKDKQKAQEEKAVKSLYKVMGDSLNHTDHFQVDIEALVKESDNFQLFYSEDYLLTFSSENKLTTFVKDSTAYQTIRFDLDKDIFPERYRFDLGANRNQKEINIKSISIRYENKEVYIPRDSLGAYFVENEYLRHENGIYYFSTIEKNGKITYDPYLLCSHELIRLFERL